MSLFHQRNDEILSHMENQYRREKGIDLLYSFLQTPESREEFAEAIQEALKKDLNLQSLILRFCAIEWGPSDFDITYFSTWARKGEYFFSSRQVDVNNWKISLGQVTAPEANIVSIKYGTVISYRLEGINPEAPLIEGFKKLLTLENSMLLMALEKYIEQQSTRIPQRIWSGKTAPTTVKIMSNNLDDTGKSCFKSILCNQMIFERIKKIDFGFDAVTDPRLNEILLRGSLFGVPIFVADVGERAFFFRDLIGRVSQSQNYLKVIPRSTALNQYGNPGGGYEFDVRREISVVLDLNGVEVLIPSDNKIVDIKPIQFNRYNALTMKGFF
jgi:hypothetical protein